VEHQDNGAEITHCLGDLDEIRQKGCPRQIRRILLKIMRNVLICPLHHKYVAVLPCKI